MQSLKRLRCFWLRPHRRRRPLRHHPCQSDDVRTRRYASRVTLNRVRLHVDARAGLADLSSAAAHAIGLHVRLRAVGCSGLLGACRNAFVAGIGREAGFTGHTRRGRAGASVLRARSVTIAAASAATVVATHLVFTLWFTGLATRFGVGSARVFGASGSAVVPV